MKQPLPIFRLLITMSASPMARAPTGQDIPNRLASVLPSDWSYARRVVITSEEDLPADYSTTPGGTMFGTTPGGTMKNSCHYTSFC